MKSINYNISNNNNKWIVSIKKEFNTKEEALKFIDEQDDINNNDINNVDEIINEYIEKSDNKKDYVSLKIVWEQKYEKLKSKFIKKRDFYNYIANHPIYSIKHIVKSGNLRNILRGYKYKYDNHLIDKNILNELFNDEN